MKIILLLVTCIAGAGMTLPAEAETAQAGEIQITTLPPVDLTERLIQVLESLEQQSSRDASAKPWWAESGTPAKGSRGDVIIPLTALSIPIVFFVLIFALVFILSRKQLRLKEAQMAMIRAFAENNQPVPPEILLQQTPRSRFLRGSILLSIGLGLSVFAWINAIELIGLALIPGLIGLAYIVQGLLERKG